MNVLVIGAAGKTGSQVVDRAVAAGHHVTALVRDADAYQQQLAGVVVAEGDATDPDALNKVMPGQDAVIDTVGVKMPFLESNLETKVAESVVSSMKENNVQRLIAVSALGVGDSMVHAGFFFQHLMIPTFLRGSTKDKESMEEVVRTSGLEYVLVRPAVLNDQEAHGTPCVVSDDVKAHSITRGDVAQFLVKQLDNDVYVGRAVTIANS